MNDPKQNEMLEKSESSELQELSVNSLEDVTGGSFLSTLGHFADLAIVTTVAGVFL